jgi:hypothetical protein
VRSVSISLRGLGLVATQTLMLLPASIAGSAAMVRLAGNGYTGVAAGCGRLIRAMLAGYGG